MPNKHNADRHHIPKMFFKVQNWPEYEAGLRRHGSLALWIEEDALDKWQSIGPNGQARYRVIAIETCLMLRSVQNGATANRRFDGFGADVDEPGALGSGSHDGESASDGTNGCEIEIGAKGADACVD